MIPDSASVAFHALILSAANVSASGIMFAFIVCKEAWDSHDQDLQQDNCFRAGSMAGIVRQSAQIFFQNVISNISAADASEKA